MNAIRLRRRRLELNVVRWRSRLEALAGARDPLARELRRRYRGLILRARDVLAQLPDVDDEGPATAHEGG